MYFMTRLTLPSYVCVCACYCHDKNPLLHSLMCIKMSFEVSEAKVFDLIFIARENYRS